MLFDNSYSLKNYTHQWDQAINRYLRSNLNDVDYLRDKDFLKYYDRYGSYPEDALENIKKTIRNIDSFFLESYVTKSYFVVFRGINTELIDLLYSKNI